MPDDPNKRGKADRSRVSKQPHEQAYQRRKAAKKAAEKATRAPRQAKGAVALLKADWTNSDRRITEELQRWDAAPCLSI